MALVQELSQQPTLPCCYPRLLKHKAGILNRCREAASRLTQVTAPSVLGETKITDVDQAIVMECSTPGKEGYNPELILLEVFGQFLVIVKLDDWFLLGRGVDNCHLVKTVFLAASCAPSSCQYQRAMCVSKAACNTCVGCALMRLCQCQPVNSQFARVLCGHEGGHVGRP